MKKIIVLLAFLMFLPIISAINVEVEKQSSNEILIPKLDRPVVFSLDIRNLAAVNNFQLYNLLGFEMFPKGTIRIENNQTQNIELKIKPLGEFDYTGNYEFEYYIRGNDGSEQKETLIFKIGNLEDVFEVGSGEVNPESNSINIYIKNNENFDFEEINATFSSVFFEFEEKFELGPYEKKEFERQLNKEDFKKIIAGFYTLSAEVQVDDQKTGTEGIIKFAEKDIVISTSKNYGFIINTKVIKKVNEGNVIAPSETVIKTNIISRLFTSFTPEPAIVERIGANVYYTWSQELRPGEEVEITIKTNWLFPLLLIILIVAVVIVAKIYTKTDLVLRKKVSFVRTRGGEFALKVTIFVRAKKYIERVNIIDRLPLLVKIYERFGSETPTRVDEKTRRIEWNFEKLEQGEVRVLSYIIYSKVGVLGKFALPSAAAIYDKEGQIKETTSNRAFFVAEQRRGDIEE